MRSNQNLKTNRIRFGLLLAALILLISGIFQGGPADVKNKAVRICYECIGIG